MMELEILRYGLLAGAIFWYSILLYGVYVTIKFMIKGYF